MLASCTGLCTGGSKQGFILETFTPHLALETTHRLLSSSFLGLPYRILNISHKKELLRSLWGIDFIVGTLGPRRFWPNLVV